MSTLQPELTLPRLSIDPPSSDALQLRPPPVGGSAHPPPRPRDLAGLTDADVLARHRPGHADPLQVPEVLLRLHNQQHTSRQKTVSHKTRQDRADFLLRFYAALHCNSLNLPSGSSATPSIVRQDM